VLKKYKNNNFLLILSSFLLLLVVFTSPALNNAMKVLGLKYFERNVKITLLGDVMLGRSVMTKSLREGDYSYPFNKVSEKLSYSDVVFANLENPFVENCPQTDSGMKFCANEKMVEGLVNANINVVNLANNHSNDYGKKGQANTVSVLSNNGIDFVGYGNLVVKNIKGTNFGFLGYNLVSKRLTSNQIREIEDASNKVDVLIVGVHWGNEYQSNPNRFQINTAKQILNAGADVISGHHPHWIQTDEIVGDSLVYYSLGNFVFDQMWSEKTKEGLAVELTFRDGELINTNKLFTFMSSWAQPEFKN